MPYNYYTILEITCMINTFYDCCYVFNFGALIATLKDSSRQL